MALTDELPGGEFHLEDMPWDQQRKVTEAFLHVVFVRQSKRRGSFAAKDAAERTKVEWSDDRDQSQLPSPVSGELQPVVW
jgi:hypothetical protein